METTAFLADSVIVESQKLYAQGAGWNLLRTTSPFPIRHDRIGIGIIISVPYPATNQEHKMEFRLEDDDGNLLALADASPGSDVEDGKIRKLGANFNVGRPADLTPGAEQNVPIALNLNNLGFDNPGRYRFVVEIDGSEEATLPFSVLQVQPQVTPIG